MTKIGLDDLAAIRPALESADEALSMAQMGYTPDWHLIRVSRSRCQELLDRLPKEDMTNV